MGMSELIIACEMIETEINLAREKAGNDSPIIWLDRGLHEFPDQLRAKLQETIDEADVDYVLLAFGLCGNAMHGISSSRSTIVVPKFHDCIHMFLCTKDNPCPVSRPDSFYYTDGWFDSDNIMIAKFNQFAERRGYEKAKKAYRLMLKHYNYLCLIDTGYHFREESLKKAKDTAELFDLEQIEETGSNDVLERLFRRDWGDDAFLVIPPHTKIHQDQFLFFNLNQ